MRKQIPLKSTIRQPIRTLIFILLVGLATFGFVSRSVEYIILSREMNRIEEFYRTIGSLIPNDPVANNNVYHAAELIRNSPFIQTEDRRTITQATMHGVTNAFFGHHTAGGNSFQRGELAFDYKGLGNVFDSIAIVKIERVHDRYVRIHGEAAGNVGRTITMGIYDVLYGINPFFANRQYISTFEIDEYGNSQIDHLDVGGYYLIRGVLHDDNPTATAIDIFPLFDDVYFVDASDDAAMAAAFQTLADELAIIEANTHMLMLTGTRDMSLLPLVQTGVYERFQGRFINYEDYQTRNHVIVIHQRMDGSRRDARVGETVTLTLRDMRTFTDGAPMPAPLHPTSQRIPEGAEAHWRNMPAGYWVSIPGSYNGDWQDYQTIAIEVEVVGTYFISPRWYLPRWAHISNNFRHMEAFVPASIIPDGWGVVDAHIVSGAYSFLLVNPDDDVPFMAAHGAQLGEMGFSVQFVGEDPTNFLLSAVPIRNSIRINLLLFSAVLAVVLALTVFLFLRQRYKEFAILRALGISQRNATMQVAMPVLLFWLPMVVAASIGAWYFALHQAAASLQILAEIGTPADYGQATTVINFLDQMRYEAEQTVARAIPQLSLAYLVWLCVAMLFAWSSAVLVGTFSFAAKSMISLIQGVNSGGAPVRTIRETAPPANVKISAIGDILAMTLTRAKLDKFRSSIRHHARHVLRAPVKTALVVGMALLFIVALGWLDRTITFTEGEIDRLYATTEITGQIYDPTAGIDGAMWGHSIPDGSLDILMASGFVENLYTTALTRVGLFLPAYNFEGENISREMRDIPASRVAKTFSCWDTLMYELHRPAAFGLGLSGEFEIEFAPGFPHEDFHVGLNPQPNIVPVIVHENLLTTGYILDTQDFNHTAHYVLGQSGMPITHTLQLGDVVYIAPHWNGSNGTPVVIAGVYRGGHPGAAYRMGDGLIFTAHLRWDHWSAASFTMRQEKIRYTHDFLEYVNEALAYQIVHSWYNPQWGYQQWTDNFNHQAELFDAEFRMVIVPLEENLHLLQMLYPVAKILSFVLALGLSLLLMLQNAKIVAILRVLGQARYKTRFNLGMEQLTVCLAGVAVGFALGLGMGIGVATAGLLVGIYLGGAVLGTVVGVFVISFRTPMELLQVRE